MVDADDLPGKSRGGPAARAGACRWQLHSGSRLLLSVTPAVAMMDSGRKGRGCRESFVATRAGWWR